MKRAFTWCCALLEAAWRFVTGPVTVEHPRLRLSLTKLLAIAFAAVDVFVIVRGKSVDGYSLALAIACMAAAFGKPTFQGFLARWSRTDAANTTTTRTIAETVAHTIAERRDHENGFEATP